jgi:formylglycine-generating enzyme
MIRLSFKTLSLWLAALSCLLASPAGADQITYQMVTVGDPGNANDTGGTQNGAVAYSYQIGTYDVTIGQYAAFLTAVAATDTYSLYNSSMGSDGNIKGIQQNGSSGSYTYSVIGSADRPITYVSWFDAARFANWMTNGQGSGSTETGAYTLLGGATSGNAVAANPGAAFRLPTNDEWYKAAYYSPTLNSGAGGYYAYATQSNAAPGNQIGSTANQANYYLGGVYSVTQSASYSSSQNYLTDVGAFSGSGSFYGTFDQNGNVQQWNDLDGTGGSSRGLRGGSWDDFNPSFLSSSNSSSNSPSAASFLIGFRLASPGSGPSAVPEIDPNSLGSVLALVLGSLGLLERRRLKAA